MTTAEALREALVAGLVSNHWLTSPAWQKAFAKVPRHLFLPRFFALTADGQRYAAVDDGHPKWLEMVYSNAVWPTQLKGDDRRWDEALRHGPITGEPTCSSTQPSLMAIMLEALDIHDGLRVLEIGTGTGYNAALLSHRLGDDQVVSVDVDAGLVEQAKENLAEAGYAPLVAAVDGADGYPQAAPFDRLIATCSVASVPTAWLEQVRPGGIILTNLYRHLVGGALVRLAVRHDGSASGRLLDDAGGFMPLRSDYTDDLWDLIKVASKQEAGTKRRTELAPITDDGEAWTVLADLVMTGVERADLERDDGVVQWLVHPDGSWAYYEARTSKVEQGGPRRLWDDLERVHSIWAAGGSPGREGIGVTITPAGAQHTWLINDTDVVDLGY